MRRRRTLIWGFLLAMFVLFTLGSRTGRAYVNYWWFQSLGYSAVFWRIVWARLWVGTAGGFFLGGFLFLHLWIARFALRQIHPEFLPLAYMRWLHPRRLTKAFAAVCAVLGLAAGGSLASEWPTVYRFLYRQPFGVTEPLFHRDAGFYVFTLPLYSLLYQTASFAIVLAFLASLALYLATGIFHLAGGRIQIHPRARRHLAGLVAAYLLAKSWGYWLAAWNLVYSPRGVVFGASYADVHAALPALRILTVAALMAGLAALANVFRPNLRTLAASVIGWLALSVLLGTLWPLLTEEFVVKPSEIMRETPYIRYNIAMTRKAFALDRIQEKPFAVRQDLTIQAVNEDRSTMDNIRLWDWRVAANDFQQAQGLRAYYTFDPITVDRYRIGGQYREVLLSAREIAYDLLPERTWVNLHMKYTHGYGAVMAPVSAVGPEGLPVFWLKDFPPASPVGVSLTRPQIYYGLQTNDYAIVDTSQGEFDYPRGAENAYTNYQGRGDIPLGNPWSRLAFALWAGNYNILFSSDITPQSKGLIYRNILERMQRITGRWLVYDGDPYLVIVRGRLIWLEDAYTVTDRFPYAEPAPGDGPLGGYNYVRNAVKIAVDAYTGDVRYYVSDPTDPLIQTYARIFPGLFRPMAEMPEDLTAHIRYPEDFFNVQMAMYAKYHMQDPVVFYNREDLWTPAREIVGTAAQGSQPSYVTVQPYYVIIRLPGEKDPEFLLMQPMTPRGRDNMVAWVAGRSDVPHYGELIAYTFPKDSLVFGPAQVDSRINQNPDIASSLALWSQQGSQVSRGNLLVIPVRNSILYVEPLYQTSVETRLPELRRVIVAYGDRVVMAPTLDQALAELFGSAPPQPSGPGPTAPPPTKPSADVAEALKLYRQAMDALRAGDFATFGARLQELGQLLARLAGGT